MLLTKDEFNKYMLLIGDENYNQNFSKFVKQLQRTRYPFFKNMAWYVNVVQINILKNLLNIQDIQRQKKKELKIAQLEEVKVRLNEEIFICTQWIRVLQTIADGVAWRSLKFNRPLIRLLSENNSPGHIPEDYLKMMPKFLTGRREKILVNDITRCLRISDLTLITKEGKIILYEIKRSGNIIKDLGDIFSEMIKHKRWVSNQEMRQWIAQSAIDTNHIAIPQIKDGQLYKESRAEIVNLNIPVKTHFKKIKQLIKTADRKGCAFTLLEEGYFIQVAAFDKIMEDKSEKFLEYYKSELDKNLPEWCRQKDVERTIISSYDSFVQEAGQYARNILPYSVLPFSTVDCVRLMMGGLHIKVYMDLSTLKQKLEKDGREVEEVDRSLTEIRKNGEKYRKEYTEAGGMYKYNVDESLFRLHRLEETKKYTLTLPYTLVLVALSSFYQMDFLLANAKSTYANSWQRGKFTGRSMTINFTGENKVLL